MLLPEAEFSSLAPVLTAFFSARYGSTTPAGSLATSSKVAGKRKLLRPLFLFNA